MTLDDLTIPQLRLLLLPRVPLRHLSQRLRLRTRTFGGGHAQHIKALAHTNAQQIDEMRRC